MTLREDSTCFMVLSLVLLGSSAGAGEKGRVPTIDDLLTIKSVGEVRISPDGKWVAFIVRQADFKADAFINHIWIADPSSGRSFQLTRGEKSAGNMAWSPDSKWLAFTSNRAGDKDQIFAIPPDGGEAVQLTKVATGTSEFDWSPDGKTIAFTASPSKKEVTKNRKEHLGDFEVVRKEYDFKHLWTIDVAEAFKSPQTGKQRTKGQDFSVGSFSWSPIDSKIVFDAAVNPDLIQRGSADIFVLNSSDDAVTKIVGQAGPDTVHTGPPMANRSLSDRRWASWTSFTVMPVLPWSESLAATPAP